MAAPRIQCIPMAEFHPSYLLNAAAYAGTGILIFFIAFAILDRAAPCRIWREVVENKNVAVAVLAGAISLGICTIIAAAFH